MIRKTEGRSIYNFVSEPCQFYFDPLFIITSFYFLLGQSTEARYITNFCLSTWRPPWGPMSFAPMAMSSMIDRGYHNLSKTHFGRFSGWLFCGLTLLSKCWFIIDSSTIRQPMKSSDIAYLQSALCVTLIIYFPDRPRIWHLFLYQLQISGGSKIYTCISSTKWASKYFNL